MSEPPPSGEELFESDRRDLDRERYELLRRIEDAFEGPMVVLAFAWLALLVIELVRGESRAFAVAGTVIWGIFVLHFAITFFLAPRKAEHLRRNWLVALSLVLPALRILRVFRVLQLLRFARIGRGLRLFRVVTSLNRGMGALGAALRRRGFAYVAALTLLVLLSGAAGMYALERDASGGFDSYGEALWWTAMILTTLGSQDWPMTLEGRILCVVLALYAFAVFGYVTATLATFFVGRDAEVPGGGLAGARELAQLREELAAMREEMRGLAGGREGRIR